MHMQYVCATLVCSLLLVACGLAGGVAAALDNTCFPAATLSCDAAQGPLAAVVGLSGATMTRASEAWRTSGGVSQELDEAAGGIASGGCDRDQLSQAVLAGTLPIQFAALLFANDATVGERAATMVTEDGSAVVRTLLLLVGATASCTWSQGVVQQALCLRLEWLSGAFDVGAAGTSGLIAPALSAMGAAAVATLADGAIAQTLRPAVAREASEVSAALQIAIERCEQRFALDGATAEVASRRAVAFRQCAAEWMEKREERQWRDDAAAAIRCGVAAAAYAATGNIFAPIATSLGGMRGYKQNS